MKHCFLILFVLASLSITAQDLNITVSVVTPNITTTDPRIFTDLEQNITEFLNNTRWTDDEFEDYEKIEGSLKITVSEELTSTAFSGDFFIQSLRPVFNSNYTTQLVNYVDQGVQFEYNERQPIRRSEDNYFDNLSSILTFYALVMVAMDYDSFSPSGGDKYWQKANNLINSIPEGLKGEKWKNKIGDQNRFWLIENMTNPRVKPFRQAFYEYHRLSLDAMTIDPDKSKAIMTSAITAIGQVEKELPNNMVVQMFTDSKHQEIIEIYKDATRGEQEKINSIMISIDPSRADEYNDIR